MAKWRPRAKRPIAFAPLDRLTVSREKLERPGAFLGTDARDSYNGRMLRAPNESHGDAHCATHTVRQRIAELLRSSELTAQQISKQAAVAEREVADHLRHLEHSLSHGGERLLALPPRCVKCDFAFDNREKHGRPSRCPRCKSERLSKARFSVVPSSHSA